MPRRVLVSTIPAWSQNSGSDTFSSLLDGYGASYVANVYVQSDVPDSKSCSNYFRINETAVIKSVFRRNIKTGQRVLVNLNDNSQPSINNDKKLYSFFTRYRMRIFLWLRELGWKLGRWNTTELNDFISDFDPEVFIFPIESYMYFNRINQYIIDTYKPKRIVGFLWDDNFTYRQHPYNFLYRIERFFVRKSVRKLVESCDQVLSICPKMKEECDREFNVKSIIITKPKKEHIVTPYQLPNNRPIRLIYTGSLVIGRFEAIRTLTKVIEKINSVYTNSYCLDVYSQTPLSERQINKITIPGSCNFKGPIKQAEVFVEQQNTDILVFVENMNNTFNNVARLSFSTKITDYLSAGRTILAIGPENIASMEYFRDEGAAIVANSYRSIEENLLKILMNRDLMLSYAQKALDVAVANHDYHKVKKKFRDTIDF